MKTKEKDECSYSVSNAIRTLVMVRVAGFEPTASWTRTKRDTKLRHTRITLIIIASYSGSVKWKSRRGKIMRRRGGAYHVPRRR